MPILDAEQTRRGPDPKGHTRQRLSVSARIVLVRHGRAACVHGGWLDGDGLRRWRAAYDAAGLAPTERPPPALRALASQAGRVVASNLPRARDSARLLVPDTDVIVSDLLRETALPPPAWEGLRLPLGVWLALMGLGWRLNVCRSEEPIAVARLRAENAAQWLIELAESASTVVAVTHGIFRRLLAEALRSSGWRGLPWSPPRHWNAWTLTSAF